MTFEDADPMDSFRALADFLFEVGHLSATPRSGFALLGTSPQQVAEHSYRTAMIGYLLASLDRSVDVHRVVMMCLVHDLPESRTGDLHSLHKQYVRADADKALRDQTANLSMGTEIAELYRAYERGGSREAELAKDADQLELLLTLREQESRGQSKGADWLDRTVARIQTDLGRSLAAAIIGGDPSHWWERVTDPTSEPEETPPTLHAEDEG